nr:hypothetical protein [Enterovibrio nigricans]
MKKTSLAIVIAAAVTTSLSAYAEVLQPGDILWELDWAMVKRQQH